MFSNTPPLGREQQSISFNKLPCRISHSTSAASPNRDMSDNGDYKRHVYHSYCFILVKTEHFVLCIFMMWIFSFSTFRSICQSLHIHSKKKHSIAVILTVDYNTVSPFFMLLVYWWQVTIPGKQPNKTFAEGVLSSRGAPLNRSNLFKILRGWLTSLTMDN